MDLWGPRRATSLKEARSRTALVHILRLLFTIGAVLSAGWLLGTVIESSPAPDARRRAAPPALSVTVLGPALRRVSTPMTGPTASPPMTAQRRRDNVSLVDLVNPRLKDAASTTVQAREGVWNAELEVLDLRAMS